MQTDLRGRDLITLQEWTKEEIDTVLDVALQLKRSAPSASRTRSCGTGSWRCCSSSRAPARAPRSRPGWPSSAATPSSSRAGRRRSLTATRPRRSARSSGRYNDGIAIRNVDWGSGNQYIREVAAASRVPVLNMQCDLYHPHQSLADLLTIMEKKGDPRGTDDRDQLGLRRELPEADQRARWTSRCCTTRYGMNVRLVHPPEFRLPADVVDQAAENARRSGGVVRAHGRLRRRDAGADIVYAKSWGALLTAKDDAEGAEIAKKYTDWITDERRIGARGRRRDLHAPAAGRPRTSRSPTPSSTVRTRSSTTRPRTGSTPRRR